MPSVMSAGSSTWHNCSFPKHSTECQLKHGWILHNKRQGMLCIFGAMEARVLPLVPRGVALPRPGCCIIMIRIILLGKHIKQIVIADCRPCLGRSKLELKNVPSMQSSDTAHQGLREGYMGASVP